jgi:putative membrane protein
MTSTTDLLLHGWEVHPSVIVGCLALVAWYLIPRPRSLSHAAVFLLGVVILCLSLVSPIDPLGDTYLFSAHMLQHLLLILMVPPLLLLGLTQERVAHWMKLPSVRRAAAALGNPVAGWCSNMLMMLAWHLPVLYNAANRSVPVHIVEHLCFLVTGCMFWWPIFTPLKAERMSPGNAMLYLFGAAVISTLLGIVITFLPVGLYEPYLHPVDELGALNLIRNTWGISAAEDQKLAGLLMWVPGCMIYFVVMLLELGRWFRTPEADKQALRAAQYTPQTTVHHG